MEAASMSYPGNSSLFVGKFTAVSDAGLGQLYVDPYTSVLSFGPPQTPPPDDGTAPLALGINPVVGNCITFLTGYLVADATSGAMVANSGPEAALADMTGANYPTQLGGTTSGCYLYTAGPNGVANVN